MAGVLGDPSKQAGDTFAVRPVSSKLAARADLVGGTPSAWNGDGSLDRRSPDTHCSAASGIGVPSLISTVSTDPKTSSIRSTLRSVFRFTWRPEILPAASRKCTL